MEARKRRHPASQDRRTGAIASRSSSAESGARASKWVMAAFETTRIVVRLYAEELGSIPDKTEDHAAMRCRFRPLRSNGNTPVGPRQKPQPQGLPEAIAAL